MIPPVRVERVDSPPVRVEIPVRRRGWFAVNITVAVLVGAGGATGVIYGLGLL